MRRIAGLWLILLACSSPVSPPQESVIEVLDTLNTEFDAQLAEDLGADSYGMKTYVFAFLKAGPNRDQDEQKAIELQRAHLDNINRLAEEGKLVLAGPFMDEGSIRGIYVFNVESLEEAKALTATDPAIKAGRLEMELHPWYGSASLLKLNDIHKRIARDSP